MTAAARVFVAQAETAERALVAQLLRRAGYGVRALRSGEEILAAAAEELPALVVLDIRLPGLNGYEVCRQLRDAYGENLPIVFVSAERTESFDRVAGLLVGADDYIVAPFDAAELIARVRRLTERARAAAEPAPAATAVASLTAREHEVLALLSQGYRSAQIADELFISPKTVATHIQHVIKKLGVHDRTQAVAVALGAQLSADPA
jgi:DNA-binding NarL/FixJ family response regulator